MDTFGAVTDEAVYAAAFAVYGSGFDGSIQKDAWLADFRKALEAAAPYMLAEAWDVGATAGWRQSGEGWNAEYPDESTGECSVDMTANPYRSQE